MRELVNEVNGASKVNLRPDIAKWVEALRSGEYKQAKGALQVGDGYCCLGVYCKVMGLEFIPSVPVSGDEEDLDDYEYGVKEGNSDLYYKLRYGLLNWSVVENGISMNDNGKSFVEIADMIEEYYTKENADE